MVKFLSVGSVVAISLSVAMGCTSAGLPPPGGHPLVSEAASPILGVGDVVEIAVFRDKDLNGSYRVSETGAIEFPLIGKVVMSGKTPDQVAEEMRSRLADGYLTDPQVSVLVRESTSRKVHVLGQVSKPGTFGYEPGMTIIQAVTNAGGFNKLASANRVNVTRLTKEGEQRFTVKVGDISEGDASNFQLEPGDIVFVPETVF